MKSRIFIVGAVGTTLLTALLCLANVEDTVVIVDLDRDEVTPTYTESLADLVVKSEKFKDHALLSDNYAEVETFSDYVILSTPAEGVSLEVVPRARSPGSTVT